MPRRVDFAKHPKVDVNERGEVSIIATLADSRDERWHTLAQLVVGPHRLSGSGQQLNLTIGQGEDLRAGLDWLMSVIVDIDETRRREQREVEKLQGEARRQLAQWWEDTYLHST